MISMALFLNRVIITKFVGDPEVGQGGGGGGDFSLPYCSHFCVKSNKT